MPPPSVLFVASECAGFVKAGGLGDVIAALPVALRALGHDARIVIPRYDAIPTTGLTRHPSPMGVPLGAGDAWCGVFETRLPGTDVPVYLLDHERMFGRGYLYDPPGATARDNLLRFGLLSRGALQLCKYLGWSPDVFHVHDWPTALLPVMLNTVEAQSPLGRAASVLTIHNLAHQAKFPASDLAALHIPASEMRPDSLEDFGGVNPLKGGLFHATKLTAVSPTYAAEIRTPGGGAGLDGVLRFRGGDLVGILNGIDDATWDPAHDPHLAAPFDAQDLSGKAACKAALQREMGLAVRPDVPLLGVVSRLSAQKGTDVVLAALPRILDLDTQMVIVGSGDPASEGYLLWGSHRGGDRFRAWVGFSEPLAHRVEAGSDLFLMPSRFEPCGLNQMYSLRYGTIPVVHRTGGLADSVRHFDPATGQGTGCVFNDFDGPAVQWGINTTLDWFADPASWGRLVGNAMAEDFSWGRQVVLYEQVYGEALAASRA